MLELRNLKKCYGNSTAVKDVNCVIEKGEFFCLLGPSGCGKTTILRMIAGFEKPTSGQILLNGQDIAAFPPNKRDVNTVFQNYALFPSMNIYENIAYGLRAKKVNPNEIDDRVKKVMSVVKLESFKDRMPHQLSGGQQQRVALARALVNNPSILLLDEPLSALDKKIAEQTRIELMDIQKKIGITFIFVTHNQTEAMTMADRIAIMKDGEMLQCAPPREVYDKPTNYFTADFIGAMNFFDAKITGITDEGCELDLKGVGKIELHEKKEYIKDKEVVFCIRPERLKISMVEPKEFENSINGTIEHKLYLGDTIQYIIRLNEEKTINVNFPNYLPLISSEFFDLNEKVYIIWSKTSGIVLNGK